MKFLEVKFHCDRIKSYVSFHQGYVTNGWNVLAVSIQDTPPFSPYMKHPQPL